MSKPVHLEVKLLPGETSAKLVSRFISKSKSWGADGDVKLTRYLKEKSASTRVHVKKSDKKRLKKEAAIARKKRNLKKEERRNNRRRK